MNELQENSNHNDDINSLKEVQRVVHEAYNRVTNGFQEYDRLRNHDSVIALGEAVRKIDATVDNLNPKNSIDLLQLAVRVAAGFVEVIARLFEIESVMRSLVIVEVRESIIFDSSMDSLRKAIIQLMAYENHNVIEQSSYRKYPQDLYISTNRDNLKS